MGALRHRGSLKERVLLHSVPEPNTGCWIWTAHILWHGYGHVSFGGRKLYAHRAAYEAFKGPVPQGLQLDHLCRNRWCVNPDHLEPVTRSENQKRSPLTMRVAITHCRNGHPYDKVHKEGWRYCSICSRESCRRYEKRVKRGRRRRQAAKEVTQ